MIGGCLREPLKRYTFAPRKNDCEVVLNPQGRGLSSLDLQHLTLRVEPQTQDRLRAHWLNDKDH